MNHVRIITLNKPPSLLLENHLGVIPITFMCDSIQSDRACCCCTHQASKSITYRISWGYYSLAVFLHLSGQLYSSNFSMIRAHQQA
ncbi:hypothetical protein QN277_012034 [Acacia crassicarpa]|uniref:Uncharacterized protein n=1 Tax=Acacia crassicarpa TaxID=499986 RepID=A0AAE1N0B2_9FABA|nr:hypothetical protein QN277_012034 [Acacia crassicarpa]